MPDGAEVPQVRVSHVRGVGAEVRPAPLEGRQVVVGGAADGHELLQVVAQPILVSLGAGTHSLSVATLVRTVSDGADIWVALRFSYH